MNLVSLAHLLFDFFKQKSKHKRHSSSSMNQHCYRCDKKSDEAISCGCIVYAENVDAYVSYLVCDFCIACNACADCGIFVTCVASVNFYRYVACFSFINCVNY